MEIKTIKVGDYLKDTIEHKLDDGTIDTEYKYYLVLDVSDTNIEAIPFGGSPLHIYDVFDKKEIEKDKLISIIKKAKSENVYKSYMTHYGNLYRQECVGTQYIWDGKTVMIPADNIYYSGNGVWREKPTAKL